MNITKQLEENNLSKHKETNKKNRINTSIDYQNKEENKKLTQKRLQNRRKRKMF